MAKLFEKDGRHQTKGLNRFPPFRAVSGLLDGLTFGLLDFRGERTGKNSIIGAVKYKRGILGASFGNFMRGAVIGALVLGAIALTGGLAAVPLLGGLGVVGGALAVGAANATLGVARHGAEMAANVISAPFVLTAKLFKGVKNMLGFGGGQQMAQGMGRSMTGPSAGAGQEGIMGKLIGAAAATIAAKMGVDSFMGALADKVSGIFGGKSAESSSRSSTASGERASQPAGNTSQSAANNSAPTSKGFPQSEKRVRAAQQWADNWGGVGLEGDAKKEAVGELKNALRGLTQLRVDERGSFLLTDEQLKNPQCQKDLKTLADAMKRELDFLSKSPDPAHQELFLKRSEEIAKAAAHPVPDANGNIAVSPYALLARENPNDPDSRTLADNLAIRGQKVAQNRADAIQRARETVGLDPQRQPAVAVETSVTVPQPEAPANGADKQGEMSAKERAKAVLQDLDAIFGGLPEAAQMRNQPEPDRASIGSALLNAGVSHSGSADKATAGHGTGKTEADIRASRTQATPN